MDENEYYRQGIMTGVTVTVIISVFVCFLVWVCTAVKHDPTLKSPGQLYKLYQEATDRELKFHIDTINKENLRHSQELKVK